MTRKFRDLQLLFAIVAVFLMSLLSVRAQVKTEQFRYTDPFVPVWTVGDDTSAALIKPTVFYKEIPGTKIEIPNMPAIRDQGVTGLCRAFSLAVLVQKYTCDIDEIADCANPPPDQDISYFGMSFYTNQLKDQPNTFTFDSDGSNSMVEIIANLSKSRNYNILEICSPSGKLTESLTGASGVVITPQIQTKWNKFLVAFEDIYQMLTNKNSIDREIKVRLVEINRIAGLDWTRESVEKAVREQSANGNIKLLPYNRFLSNILFGRCRQHPLPTGFLAVPYPLDTLDITPDDIKNRVIEGLKLGKPVLFPSLCVSSDVGYECKTGHSVVISGYKKVCAIKGKEVCRDVFKIHNSWGKIWQNEFNDGWIDADEFTKNTKRHKSNGKYRITSSAVIWLKP